jgi:hypothetical protein
MDVDAFAEKWIENWNSRDIERVLDHYAEDAEFVSPNAVAIVGTGVIRGRNELRKYWEPALAKRADLKFHLKAAFRGHEAISIYYGDELGREVVETLILNEDGKARVGCACYA